MPAYLINQNSWLLATFYKTSTPKSRFCFSNTFCQRHFSKSGNEMDDIIQLKIVLEKTKPAIWRRIQVEKDTTFFELHSIIQIAMGRGSNYPFNFKVDGYILGEPTITGIKHSAKAKVIIDSREIDLESVFVKPGERFTYSSDSQNRWEHKIILAKFLPKDPKQNYPNCIEGELCAPPEDCPSVEEYYDWLDIIQYRNHRWRRSVLKWLGKNFDPARFDIEIVNKRLSNLVKDINK